MARPFNFSAGPAVMPEEVLAQAAREMLDWQGTGMGVMEMSHRGKAFVSICEQAEADLRELLAVPESHHILFMQGGGLAENAIVPLNLSRGGAVDVVVTGSWSQKSLKEAKRYADARAAASSEADGHTTIPAPSTWQLRADAAYVHICTNETIHGVEFQALPDLQALGCNAPLVIDFSSHVASRPVDWRRVGLAFGGAQKNLGPAGLTLVVVRDDLLGHARKLLEAHSTMVDAMHGGAVSGRVTLGVPDDYAMTYLMPALRSFMTRFGEVEAFRCTAGSAKLTSEAIGLVLQRSSNHGHDHPPGFPTAPAHDRRHAHAPVRRAHAGRLHPRRAQARHLPRPLAAHRQR